VTAALLLAVASERLVGQAVFPSAIDLVAVDVTVVDRDGRPLTDLRPEDFEIKVGGRRRKVVSAQLVRHVTTTSAPDEPARVETAFATNRDQPPGRLVVLVPDLGWMSEQGGRAVVEAAGRFVSRLAPQDKVALLTIPVGPSVDFTTDHARVVEALQRVRGSRRWRPTTSYKLSLGEAMAGCAFAGDQEAWAGAVARECGLIGSVGSNDACVRNLAAAARQECLSIKAITESSVAALLQVLEALRPIDGPKTMVLVSQGLVTGRSAGNLGADQSLYTIADAAARARVSLYTVLADRAFVEAADVTQRDIPETRALEENLFRDGLEAVAGYTGGPLLRTMTTADFAFDRIASETSATWLLSFEPEKDDRDGRGHDIKVAVARNGVAGARGPASRPRRRRPRASPLCSACAARSTLCCRTPTSPSPRRRWPSGTRRATSAWSWRLRSASGRTRLGRRPPATGSSTRRARW
jgi:VWFA-related protein